MRGFENGTNEEDWMRLFALAAACFCIDVLTCCSYTEPNGRRHTAEWHRADTCVTEQSYRLVEKGYSREDARVGAVMNCSKEIDAVKGDGWEK